MKLFSPHLLKLDALFKSISAEYSTPGQGKRLFASKAFEATSLSWRYMRDTLFNRKTKNDEYVKLYEEQDYASRKPFVYVQKDISSTYALHKSFIARHKTRLQYYRDDFSDKHARIPSSMMHTARLVDNLNKAIQGAE